MNNLNELYTDELYVYVIKNIKRMIDENKIEEINNLLDILTKNSIHSGINNYLFIGYINIFKKIINKFTDNERARKIENLNFVLSNHLNSYLYFALADTPVLVNRIEDIMNEVLEMEGVSNNGKE